MFHFHWFFREELSAALDEEFCHARAPGSPRQFCLRKTASCRRNSAGFAHPTPAASKPWLGRCASRPATEDQMPIRRPVTPGSKLKLGLWCTALLCLGESSGFGLSDRATDWLTDEVKFSEGKLRLGIFD